LSASWVQPDWPAPAGVRALQTFRNGGASAAPYASLNLGSHVGDAAAAVAENRRRLALAAGLPSEPAWLTQAHGINVADLDAAEGVGGTTDREHPGRALGPADAAFTRQPGRVCAILTADCLPILLAADSGELVAAVHAGWRGLAGGVIEATVQAMAAPPQSLMAWLGPAIGPQHFEVGAEVREALLAGDSQAGADAMAGADADAVRRASSGAQAAFAVNARGRFMADLSALARRRLAALGVSRIHGGGECTFAAGDRYFSHRRDGVTGRQATLIWLEQPERR
jgi:YfiH family protein